MTEFSDLSPKLFALFLFLQTSKPLEFEVASLKPSMPGVRYGYSGCHGVDTPSTNGVPLGRCVIPGSPFYFLTLAFDIQDRGVPASQRIVGYPAWFRESWTLQAKADAPTYTEAELKKMLQALLKERFKLEFHTEIRELRGYALVVDPKGPKLTPTSGIPKPGPMDAPPSLKPQLGTGMTPGNVTMTAYNQTMAGFAIALSRTGPSSFLDGPVVDKTGLTAGYDFVLKWGAGTGEFLGQTLATALQEQLGLKLVKEPKIPIEYIVIDRAEKPPVQ